MYRIRFGLGRVVIYFYLVISLFLSLSSVASFCVIVVARAFSHSAEHIFQQCVLSFWPWQRIDSHRCCMRFLSRSLLISSSSFYPFSSEILLGVYYSSWRTEEETKNKNSTFKHTQTHTHFDFVPCDFCCCCLNCYFAFERVKWFGLASDEESQQEINGFNWYEYSSHSNDDDDGYHLKQ